MPTSIEEIRGFLDTRRVRYFLPPDADSLLVPYRLTPRMSVKLNIRLDNGGRYLWITCDDLPMVESSHPMIGEVQQCLLAMNLSKRFVKFSQDPSDGEIVVSGEAWIEDMDFTQAAFDRLMMNFLSCLQQGGEALESVLAGHGMPQAERQPFETTEEEGQTPAAGDLPPPTQDDQGEADDGRRDAA